MQLWADTGRGAKMAGLGVLLALLGAYHAWVSMTVVFGYRDCLEDPARFDGTLLVLPLWEVTRIDGPHRYAASKVLKDIPIEGDTSPLHVGSTVSVKGRFRAADAVVVEEQRELHVLRDWKERLGIFGFLVMAAAAPFFFRFREWRLVERG